MIKKDHTPPDPLTQLVIDNSRHVLYTRSDNNTITAYDLGADGKGLKRVASISMGRITQRSLSALRSADKTLVSPIVWISVIPASESLTLHLLAVTKSGTCTMHSQCACTEITQFRVLYRYETVSLLARLKHVQ